MDDSLRQQQLYYARRELGLCVKCGMPIEPCEGRTYVMCAECRRKQQERRKASESKEWRREYMREYRSKTDEALEKLAAIMQNLRAPAEMELTIRKRKIPDDHKCWGCEWSRWHGDRFFCPLVGCVKKPMKQEVADDYRTEDNAD